MEGAEVLLYAEEISAAITGCRLIKVKPLGGRYRLKRIPGLSRVAGGAAVASVHVHGALMWWNLRVPKKSPRGGSHSCDESDEMVYAMFTLGRTGWWTRLHVPCAQVCFTFEGSRRFNLFLADARNRAALEIGRLRDLSARLEQLGPTPFTSIYVDIASILARESGSIAQALVSGRILAGIGSYVISEALYRAGIAPTRAAAELTGPEIRALHNAIKRVCGEMYTSGKGRISIYSGESEPPKLERPAAVYHMLADPEGHKTTVVVVRGCAIWTARPST